MSDTERLINRQDTERESEPEGLFDTAIRPVVAEFVGTALFVFVGCCALVSLDIVAAALGHGLTIALLVMALGSISGGHFNPAVTVGVTLAGGLRPALTVMYVIGQLLGGLLGAALVRGTLPDADYLLIKGGTHQLGEGVEPGWATLIESILTFLLIFVILLVAVNPKTKTKLAPLAIGFVVTVDIMAGGGLTGASMNPARALGPAICASAKMDGAFTYHWIYWVGPLVGGSVAAFFYKFFFATPRERWIARQSV